MSNVKVKATKKPVKPVIVVVYILLVILAVVYLAPLLWMLDRKSTRLNSSHAT